jgi:hypothetical protein
MIDHRTTFVLAVHTKGQEYNTFPVLGMRMEGYPEPTLKKVTVYKDGIEQDIKFDQKKMFVTENINFSVIKIQVLDATGKIEVKTNRLMNNIEVLGFMELGRAQYLKGMFDQSNRHVAAQN